MRFFIFHSLFTLLFSVHPTNSQITPFTTPSSTPQYGPTPTVEGRALITAQTTTHYQPTWPPTLLIPSSTGAAAISTLNYVESTFEAGLFYTSIRSAVYMAAPTDAQFSLAVSGYDFNSIVAAPWYSDNVDPKWRDLVNKQEDALQSAFNSVTGNEASTKNSAIRLRLIALVWVVWFVVLL